METEHSPLPWHISEKQIGEAIYRCEIIDAAGQRVFLREVESLPERQMLDRLVAAVNQAPLVEELVGALDKAANPDCDHHPDACYCVHEIAAMAEKVLLRIREAQETTPLNPH